MTMLIRTLTLSLLLTAAACAQNNMSFEYGMELFPERAQGWYYGTNGYEVERDTTIAAHGGCSLRLRYVSGDRFGLASQQIGVADKRGNVLVLTGQIRTEAVEQGYAGFWLRLDGEDGTMLRLDNMSDRGVSGTTEWTACRIEMLVEDEAGVAVFGPIFPGKGTAWFDDLHLDVLPLSAS